MPESVAGLLDKADLAIAAAARVTEGPETSAMAMAATMLRRRLDYPNDLLLVGFVGGTGSGKSSLVNAVAGAEIAVVGGLRPTTDRPMAVASRRSSQRIEGYLTDIGIDDLAIADMPDWLCMIDLPDTDSVELSHRLQVEALVPRLDTVVWVVDPEKYRDSSLHHGYLQPMSTHSDRFVFVLNQVDRLSSDTRPVVLSDLHEALRDDGIESPVVLATAAQPPAGPMVGVDALVDELRSRLGEGVISKALADLDEAASTLVAGLGRSDLDFEARSKEVSTTAAQALTRDREADATDVLVGFVETIADESGEAAAERIGMAATGVSRLIRQIAEEMNLSPEALQDEDTVRAAIDQQVLNPVRELLRERASALALATDLSLSVAGVRARMGV